MTHFRQLRSDHPDSSALTVTRRTLARGAAWSVPVLATVAAAPALAASGGPAPGPLTIVWYDAIWSPSAGGIGDLMLSLGYYNTQPGAVDATVTNISVYSTYHAPASNGTQDQLIATSAPSNTTKVGGGSTIAVGYPIYLSTWNPRPPVDADQHQIARIYYDGGPSTIPCVSARRYPKDADYPFFGTRLTDDKTYIVVTYSAGASTYTFRADMNGSVGCRVGGGFCT